METKCGIVTEVTKLNSGVCIIAWDKMTRSPFRSIPLKKHWKEEDNFVVVTEYRFQLQNHLKVAEFNFFGLS
jgi:hypothetical protein